jgi:pimeloyl-ACP methyl ester carboxylesterase
MSTSFFTASDGARLHFSDEGAGVPVLALSGVTRTSADFDFLAPHLPDVRLIRMDYRGRGHSDRTGPATYTVPREARDALDLLDHLGVARAAILGTSRGGLIGMFLAATARGRLTGLCLNDVGPVLERDSLLRIADYVGRQPSAPTLDAFATALPGLWPGFDGVPGERWRGVAERLCEETGEGLRLRYDPALRESFRAGVEAPAADLWPLFDACAGLPLALIRGANTDLLAPGTVAEMRARRPDMIHAEVPGRGHAPFLDEPESLSAIRGWLGRLA